MTLSCMCCYLFLWMAAAVLPSFQATSNVLYPKINGTESLSCECPDHTCQEVFWYRYRESRNTTEFLMYVNSAGREEHEQNIKASQFKGSVSSTSKVVVYYLRLIGLQEDDAGFYSCMFKTKHMIPTGYYIMPGVNPPTDEPPAAETQKPKSKSCYCKRPSSPKGCEYSVLWPGIGSLMLLAVTLVGTLYYFSRLPKKCRHRFTKTNQLR